MPGPDKPCRARWPRGVRLTRGSDIQLVMRHGQRVTDGWLRVIYWDKPAGQARFAISVRKKVGHACARNREKRRVREALRTAQNVWPKSGWGVVIIDRPAPNDISGKERNRIIADLLASLA